MSAWSAIKEELVRHLRLSAHDTGIVAHSYRVLAESESLLQTSRPTTFLGKRQHALHPPGDIGPDPEAEKTEPAHAPNARDVVSSSAAAKESSE